MTRICASKPITLTVMLTLAAIAILPATAATAAAAEDDRTPAGHFYFDPADETIEATLIPGENNYDPDLAAFTTTGQIEYGLTGAEFIPGSGDKIWIGEIWNDLNLNDVDSRKTLSDRFARSDAATKSAGRANPTLVMCTDTQLRITQESDEAGQWDVYASPHGENPSTIKTWLRLTPGDGPDINHNTATTGNGKFWVVWQGGSEGQFDIFTREVTESAMGKVELVSTNSPRGDWHPDVAMTSDGTVYVVWDRHDGESYDVVCRVRRNGQWGGIRPIATGPDFQARASIAGSEDNHVFVAWEEGAPHWGKPYTSRMRRTSAEHIEYTDVRGPLHSYRRIRMAMLDKDGRAHHLVDQLPQPSFELARKRKNLAKGVHDLGVFYERPVLTVDMMNRVWVAYRHRYATYIGAERHSHTEVDWGVYARCLTVNGWSRLYRFDIGQGDGMQRLELEPTMDGIAVVYTTGRTDRRENNRPRGIVFATISAEGAAPDEIEIQEPMEDTADSVAAASPARVTRIVGKQGYSVYFGDLHRHTDLSLCFSPIDGTLDDTYRYGSDVAGYQFLGITDHSRDIAMGDPLSQLWWRSVKEVTRHELSPNFIPMFAYERSRGGEDHNVISLRSDMLRKHTYPHPEFWTELDEDTITIPHQTITADIPPDGVMPLGLHVATWSDRDDAHRPLIEIYQGCRDRSIERDAHEGLARGHLLGFIASSDHLSTSHSYAGVWSPKPTREAVFRSMQVRRTFGATARIVLSVTSGEHWMGEEISTEAVERLHIKASGTAPIETIEILFDGNVIETIDHTSVEVDLSYDVPEQDQGVHYVYVRLTQSDGHLAWSSPLWFGSEAAK